jgi:membrane-bound lytic murein transglycosylase A
LGSKKSVLGVIFLIFFGCAAPIPEKPPPSKHLSFRTKEISGHLTDDGDKSSLIRAIEKSLTFTGQKDSTGPISGSPRAALEDLRSPDQVRRSLILFLEILSVTPDPEELDKILRERFTFWEATYAGQAQPVLLTGYYEPVFEGRLEREGDYRFPLYRRPDDLVEFSPEGTPGGKKVGREENGRMIPYYSREEIDEKGVLQGRGYELAWLKDPWERYVLHVQGSGKIVLPDGRILRVGFSGSNGRAYRSIGRFLVDRGFLAERDLSLERVRAFLEQNPECFAETLSANERYVFFRFLPNQEEGPIGALGVPLTEGRSIATDFSVFPKGALAYLIGWEPVFDEQGRRVGKKLFRRFVLNQDTGAAMKGPFRADLFMGSGERAGWAAGEMREEGKIYLLLAR